MIVWFICCFVRFNYTIEFVNLILCIHVRYFTCMHAHVLLLNRVQAGTVYADN